ncbi:MAG: hypothetical protein SGARI_004781 [Bacillariaceae sp.]
MVFFRKQRGAKAEPVAADQISAAAEPVAADQISVAAEPVSADQVSAEAKPVAADQMVENETVICAEAKPVAADQMVEKETVICAEAKPKAVNQMTKHKILIRAEAKPKAKPMAADQMAKNKMLISAVENGDINLVKQSISMGADNSGHCLRLCMEADNVADSNFKWFNVLLVLLEAGVTDSVRDEAIKYAQKEADSNSRSQWTSDKQKVGPLSAMKFMIENCPKEDEFPMEKIAAKTKQAWSSLLFSETQSDCTIVFKTGENSGKQMTLHAHRNILAASSPYFKRYFEGAADGSWGGDVGICESMN